MRTGPTFAAQCNGPRMARAAARLWRKRWGAAVGCRRFAIQGAVLLAAHLLCAGPALPADETHSAYQIEAAYLFNFLKFVEWPGDAAAGPQAQWVIGVLGDSPVGAELSLLAEGKNIEGRGLLVKKIHAKDNPRECHILFVSASEEKRLPSLLSSLQGSSVLTVADFSRFIERGGMIQFVTDGSRLRMDIDLGATGRARLKVSSKLLALAQAVTETVHNEPY